VRMSTVPRWPELMTVVGNTSARVAFDPSFEEFVARGSASLLRSAYLLTGDRGSAEELLQVALVRVGRRWDAAREAPQAYAHRVLVNLLHDRRRRLSRRVVEAPLEELIERHDSAGDNADALIDRVLLASAVRRLPTRQREVVVLRFFADLSVSETAAAIAASEGTVKTHTSRALNTLRGALSESVAPPTTPKGY